MSGKEVITTYPQIWIAVIRTPCQFHPAIFPKVEASLQTAEAKHYRADDASEGTGHALHAVVELPTGPLPIGSEPCPDEYFVENIFWKGRDVRCGLRMAFARLKRA